MRCWGLPLRSCVLLLFSGPLYSYHTAACCPHKREHSCFTCADYSLCLEYSSLRYAHGFLLHFLQVFYSERLAQVPPKKTQHPVPLLSFLIFLQSTRHRWTFKMRYWDFSGGVEAEVLPTQGTQVHFLVRELDSTCCN